VQELIAEMKKQGLLSSQGQPELSTLVDLLSRLRPDPEAVRALQAAAETAPKTLAKAARRLLHRWRSQGLAASGPAPGQTWTLKSVPRALEALVSHIDRRGDRFLFYAFSRPTDPYLVLLAVGRDTAGLTFAEVYQPANKRDYETLRQGVRRMEGFTFASVAPGYCRAWLHHYYRLNRKHNRPVPRDFELYRANLEPEETLPEPLVYRYLPADDVEAELQILLAGSDQLLEEKEMHSWALEGPAVEQAAERLRRQRESRLVISPLTARELADKVKTELLEEMFSPEFRKVYARRLEEMAFLFWETGRPASARRAVALARALTRGEKPAFIPFFRQLVERSLAAGPAEAAEMQISGPRLYLPGRSPVARP
jgi:hypothetical protein